MNDASQILAFTLGAFAGTLILAFLVSRLGLHIRRSSRFEPATGAGVHAVSFLILSIGAWGSQPGTPNASVLTVFVAQAIVLLIDMLRLPRPEDYSDEVPQTLRSLAGMRAVAVVADFLLASDWSTLRRGRPPTSNLSPSSSGASKRSPEATSISARSSATFRTNIGPWRPRRPNALAFRRKPDQVRDDG